MRILLYAGPAPTRDQVLAYSAPIVQRAATALTLVTGGGTSNAPLLDDALTQLDLPGELPCKLLSLAGEAEEALYEAARQEHHDLAICGRLQAPLRRLVFGQRSKLIARQLDPAVLRVSGRTAPIQRILLATAGGSQTLHQAFLLSRLARPLGASVTLLHVLSQQLLYFDGFEAEVLTIPLFLESDLPEAQMLQKAAAILNQHQVPTNICVKIGPIVETILRAASEYDLLVIGNHHSSTPMERILFRDLADDLLDLSPLPVMVTRDRTPVQQT